MGKKLFVLLIIRIQPKLLSKLKAKNSDQKKLLDFQMILPKKVVNISQKLHQIKVPNSFHQLKRRL